MNATLTLIARTALIGFVAGAGSTVGLALGGQILSWTSRKPKASPKIQNK